ncbi:MAG: DNA repair protein RadA, partial [Chloroflexi bacterium]|nr:DNA repair protein RadA [Chloroflexota bacterium]
PKAVFICQGCGARQLRWAGRCPSCGAWNTLVETLEQRESSKAAAGQRSLGSSVSPVPLSSISDIQQQRLQLHFAECNRVFGGGIVPGSVTLIGGDPGIGKSTLLLQMCGQLATTVGPVLYVTAEESAQQVKLRAERVQVASPRLLVLPETDVDRVIEHIISLLGAPHTSLCLVVIDSIQSVSTADLESSAGTVGQVRECAQRLVEFAKQRYLPIILVGHVTKEGAVAGPRVLEHMVDAVLYLEGERLSNYRILRGVKNRFGSTDEIGLFEMQDRGLIEVEDASSALFSLGHAASPGTIAALILEGTRPLVVEVQALAAPAAYGPPRRQANGYDINRLLVLLAVLNRRAGLPVQTHDIYVKVVGGVRLTEPAADLPVALAIASSLINRTIAPHIAAAGEVGLVGELRPVRQLDRRLSEAARLGFRRVLIPDERRGYTSGTFELAQQGLCVDRVGWLVDALAAASLITARRDTPIDDRSTVAIQPVRVDVSLGDEDEESED